MRHVARSLARPLGALLGLAVLAIVLSPAPSRTADAQVAMWTSCRNVCMRSCQWEKRVMGLPVDDRRVATIGSKCYESAECTRLDGVFAPSDPKIDADATTAAVRLGQCKKCAATGRKGRCPPELFGLTATTGGASYGGRSYGGSTYGGGRDHIGEFTRCFEQSVRDKIAEGYYVKNYSFMRHVRTAGAALNPFLDKSRGGRCGEYGEWGMKWIKPCVDQYFPGAVVDDLFVEEKSTVHKKHVGDYVDAIYEANHRAARVVLPDGRRFVVDYWDAVGSGSPELQPQTVWVKKWRDRIGFADSVLSASDDEAILKKAVLRLGEEKGFDLFRKQNKGLKNAHPEIWIKSWQREPW
jgi:hypothetical protein